MEPLPDFIKSGHFGQACLISNLRDACLVARKIQTARTRRSGGPRPIASRENLTLGRGAAQEGFKGEGID
jgi:hypothetical protein